MHEIDSGWKIKSDWLNTHTRETKMRENMKVTHLSGAWFHSKIGLIFSNLYVVNLRHPCMNRYLSTVFESLESRILVWFRCFARGLARSKCGGIWQIVNLPIFSIQLLLNLCQNTLSFCPYWWCIWYIG